MAKSIRKAIGDAISKRIASIGSSANSAFSTLFAGHGLKPQHARSNNTASPIRKTDNNEDPALADDGLCNSRLTRNSRHEGGFQDSIDSSSSRSDDNSTVPPSSLSSWPPTSAVVCDTQPTVSGGLPAVRPYGTMLIVENGPDGQKLEAKTTEKNTITNPNEAMKMLHTNQVALHRLEDILDHPGEAVSIRREFLASSMQPSLAAGLKGIPSLNFDYEQVIGACCENVVGYVSIPVGVIGPLIMDGEPLFVPLATTEGCLVASINRGAAAIRRASELKSSASSFVLSSTKTTSVLKTSIDYCIQPPSDAADECCVPHVEAAIGVQTTIYHDGMTRAPVLQFPSVMAASSCYKWLQSDEGFEVVKSAFDATTQYGQLRCVTCHLAGRLLFVRFVASTGDAMGMNMVSKGSESAIQALLENFPSAKCLGITGNVCADKKPAAINWINGRGKSVAAEARIPACILHQHLKTTADAMVQLNTAKNLVGSAVAGATAGGSNAQAANVVAAMFIACGQDPAQVVVSSNCITLMERCGDNDNDLYICVTMPSLEVGTVGGGTVLSAQSACLKMLGIHGPGDPPGSNAAKFARIVAATVLAGELSLMAALTSGDLVKAHMKMNRKS